MEAESTSGPPLALLEKQGSGKEPWSLTRAEEGPGTAPGPPRTSRTDQSIPPSEIRGVCLDLGHPQESFDGSRCMTSIKARPIQQVQNSCRALAGAHFCQRVPTVAARPTPREQPWSSCGHTPQGQGQTHVFWVGPVNYHCDYSESPHFCLSCCE